VEIYQRVVYDKEALNTTESKMSNLRLIEIKTVVVVLYIHSNEKLTWATKHFD